MRDKYLKKADSIIIPLHKKIVKPVNCCRIISNNHNIDGYEIIKSDERISNHDVCYDFGEHYTGYVSFNLSLVSGVLDAPIKLRLLFAERPFELIPAKNNDNADISYSWLQKEELYIDSLPNSINISRRYALRYLKIEVIAKTQRADFCVTDLQMEAVTSASFNYKSDVSGTPYDKICDVSVRTLRECMQEYFEDGPKRDRRLWIGDLRLQALVNYCSFDNTNLVKKCLYQFAAVDEKGKCISSTIFHKPNIIEDRDTRLLDYALLFGVCLLEYYEHTKDLETAEELFDTAYNQFEYLCTILDKDGKLINQTGWWCFIDWHNDLPKLLPMYGQAIYALDYHYKLAKILNKNDCAEKIAEVRNKLFENSFRKYYNEDIGVFSEDSVVSWAGNCYMVLSGLIEKEKAKEIMYNLIVDKNAIMPVTPYMYHYCLEAFAKLEMFDEMKNMIDSVWNGMIKYGADTFWEVYKDGDVLFSPYGDIRLNSFCHAWSCTPIYFIKKYLF